MRLNFFIIVGSKGAAFRAIGAVADRAIAVRSKYFPSEVGRLPNAKDRVFGSHGEPL